MKILIWTQYFWPENFHINTVAFDLKARGVDVTVLTGKPNYPGGRVFDGYKASGLKREECSGIEVIRIPLVPRGGARKGIALNYLSFVVSGYLFAPYALRGREFDIVFVYAPSPLLQALPAIFISWLKRAPLMIWVQDIWPDVLVATGVTKNRWILRAVGIVVRYIYQFSDSILIQSEGFRASVERWTSRKDRIRFFPNSADDQSQIHVNSEKNVQLSKKIAEKFSIVFAGNIGSAQACEIIIDAAKLLQNVPSIIFHLVGSGSMADLVCRSIAENKLPNVTMIGRMPAEDMPLIFSKASVLLLTLRDEPALSSTIPSKLQSYLAAGRPVIASCNGEAASVVAKANAGLACPAGDATALADAVLKLFQMTPEERSRLGENGRAYFEAHYRLQSRITELVTHIQDVIARYQFPGRQA
ncbi:glycosyltransferase family 4 protein [Rhodoferax sp. BLA1]|uniref:glycosyltransferase family 4 protein n=1 Tax=Rhodoferax sp. BLA1 TaxID=2576062 RepID=UPI0015D1CBDC|nr:glycosyltransferase family 4 protein [Rhodoferax sp. BLA1]